MLAMLQEPKLPEPLPLLILTAEISIVIVSPTNIRIPSLAREPLKISPETDGSSLINLQFNTANDGSELPCS